MFTRAKKGDTTQNRGPSNKKKNALRDGDFE